MKKPAGEPSPAGQPAVDPRLAATQQLSSDDGLALAPGARARPLAAFVGRFALLGELGRGGMGQVYAAYDAVLDRKVAVKLLHQREGDPAANQRLLREARAMAKIAHPNVATIHEVGEMDDRVFVAMELIPGHTLREWTAESGRSWRDIVAMYVQAGRGLVAAHDAGIVHRDFKPDNVLVGDDGRARVLDFGLARIVRPSIESGVGTAEHAPSAGTSAGGSQSAQSASDSEQLTRAGSIMGTPLYMSPEQHEGREADARSDQYNFCASLYEALYSAAPFDTSSMDSLMRSKRKADIAQPTHVPMHLKSIHKLLARGLAVDPDERWPLMEDLVEHLESYVRDDTTHTQRLTPLHLVLLSAISIVTGVGMLVVNVVHGGLQEVSPRLSFIVGGIALAVVLLFKLVMRRYIVSSELVHRIMELMAIAMTTITLHRGIDIVVGTAGTAAQQVFASNFLIVAAVAAVGGMTVYRGLWIVSLEFCGFSLVATFGPSYVPYCLAIGTFNIPILCLIWWLKVGAHRSGTALHSLVTGVRSSQRLEKSDERVGVAGG